VGGASYIIFLASIFVLSFNCFQFSLGGRCPLPAQVYRYDRCTGLMTGLSLFSL